jgi:hypothetical protein
MYLKNQLRGGVKLQITPSGIKNNLKHFKDSVSFNVNTNKIMTRLLLLKKKGKNIKSSIN